MSALCRIDIVPAHQSVFVACSHRLLALMHLYRPSSAERLLNLFRDGAHLTQKEAARRIANRHSERIDVKKR